MLKKEFEELTGIYPSDALYRCIEAKYMEMPMVRKENFCNYYKNNTDGIAELIQMLADEDEIARDEKHEEQKTLLKKEIDSLKAQLKIINRKLELEEEWKEYVWICTGEYKNNIKNASTAEEQAWCHTRH